MQSVKWKKGKTNWNVAEWNVEGSASETIGYVTV